MGLFHLWFLRRHGDHRAVAGSLHPCNCAALADVAPRQAAMADDELEPRPGPIGQRGGGKSSLAGQVLRAARRGGLTPLHRRGRGGTGKVGASGRGRAAALAMRRGGGDRRVVVKARIVRHKGVRFRGAPLTRHLAYLAREGVTRDDVPARLFDAGGDAADGEAFAGRCGEDRHHFRFIVSPEDGAELADLRAFTRELMTDMARDLDTPLDWVGLDHWNTDNPHAHVLVRGKTGRGEDLVIDRGYMAHGLRGRAEARATIELGPRSEQVIERTLAREVAAERWTELDRRLARLAERDGVIDLRPDVMGPSVRGPAVRGPSVKEGRDPHHGFLVGRAAHLARMGLARPVGEGRWIIADVAEPTLRALAERGDIIKTMHRALAEGGRVFDRARLAIHGEAEVPEVVGRLAARGLHDELTGTAYAVVEGIDGRAHHCRFGDLEATGDVAPGGIVALRRWTDGRGRGRSSLDVLSDLSLSGQVSARGATWLDRTLVGGRQGVPGPGFGQEVAAALEARARYLAGEGLASHDGKGWRFAPGLLAHLRRRDLVEAGRELAAQAGRVFHEVGEGDVVAGICRRRVTLASGRFALIDNGLGFQLVPWQPALEQRIGQDVAGRVLARGTIDWSFARPRGLSL